MDRTNELENIDRLVKSRKEGVVDEKKKEKRKHEERTLFRFTNEFMRRKSNSMT